MSTDAPILSEDQQVRAIPWLLAYQVLSPFFFIWTFGGTIFLLFLNALGLPKSQIGMVLSLFPFCGVLALVFAPLVDRWGWKRVFITAYGIRKIVMASLLLLPWVMATAGRQTGLVFFFTVMIVFSLLRALAETAYYPWSQEFVANRFRGKMGGISLALVTLSSMVALLIARHVIGRATGLSGYLVLLAAGSVLGLLSVALMIKVPGGEPRRERIANGAYGDQIRGALKDRNFVTYLGGVGAMTLGCMMMISFLPLYVKEQLGVAPRNVVALDMVMMTGSALSGLWAGWAADRWGSRPVLMPAAAVCLVLPLGWLLLPRSGAHPIACGGVLYLLYGMVNSAMAVSSERLFFNGVVPAAHRMTYTSVYYTWMGLTGGLAPLLAGALLTIGHDWRMRLGRVVVDSYSFLFLLAIMLIGGGWWLYGRVRPDDRHTTRSVLRQWLQPAFTRGLIPFWR